MIKDAAFDQTVFINGPFDKAHAPLLEAAIFCVVYFGMTPRLANERLEAGENRLDKIVQMISAAKYSIHDLSLCRSTEADEYFRMNMPFEFGIDLGMRRSGYRPYSSKKFLIFEHTQYDLKRALSDIAGQDVDHHNADFERVIKAVRDFFKVEANVKAAGPSRIISDYATFQGWMTEKKIHEGHSEREALALPTRERVEEMQVWTILGRPTDFVPA